MPEIDNLSISIKASADSAEKSLDRLVDTIGRISASLGGVNFNGFAQGAKNLSTAMQGLQNVKMPDYTRLAKGIEKIGSINSAQIQSAGTAIRELSSSLRFLDDINVSDNAKQIAQLANGISQLGYKSSTKAIDNIPKLATAMRELMATLSTAPRVSQNIIDMTNALAKLSRTGASSGRAATSLGKALDAYTLSTSRASKGSWSLASAIGKLYATYWLLFRAFGKIGDAIDISSSLTEVQNVVDVTFGEYASLVEKMSETSIADFGMSELTVKQVASRFQAMGSAMGFAQGKMADMSIELTKLTADMASFYNVEQTDVAEDLESIFTGQTRPLRTYGLDLTEATLKEWALKQGMDANIDSMTQMEKTMLRYQYVLANTTSAQGDFLRTADTWANQTRILKQNFEQLGAIIGGTFINMLKPLVKALNNVMSHIIAFAETVSNALGKIFGWKYEVGGGGVTSDLEDGAGYSDDIASGLDDAQKNAKKMRDYVLGIDELNIISPETETSTSGGGTGGAGGATGGQWVEQDSIFKEFESEIDTLYELGRYISDALSEAMESIDWESVYEKARNFGTGLAEFLNGLITPRLFGNIGITLANSLNTVFEGLNAFAITFDWTNLGVSIATGIDKFFESWDSGLSAEALSNLASGLLDSISSFISTLKDEKTFKDIGQKIVDFICGIDWKGLIYSLDGFFEALTDAIISFPTDFGLGIAEAIWEEISGQDVTLTMPKWLENLGTLFLSWISPQLGAINLTNFISDNKEEWGNNISNTLENGKNSFLDFFNTVKTNFLDWFLGIADWINTNVIQPILTFFKELWENIKSIWNGVSTWFSDNVIEPVVSFFTEFAERVQQVFEGLWIIIQAVWIIVSEWFTEYIFTPLAEGFTILWESIVSVWETVSEWFNEFIIIPLSTFFQELFNNVLSIFTNLWEGIKKVWMLVSTWFNNNVITPLKNAWNLAITEIGGFFTNLWDGIKKGVIGAMNVVISAIENGINFIINGINTVISGFNEVVDWAAKVAGVDWGGVTLIPSVSLPRIEGYYTGGFPNSASLFWAGENGVTELLGTVNGRTAVAGGHEITGIVDAVYNAGNAERELLIRQNELLAEQNALLSELSNKEIVATMDARESLGVLRRQADRQGFAFGV